MSVKKLDDDSIDNFHSFCNDFNDMIEHKNGNESVGEDEVENEKGWQ